MVDVADPCCRIEQNMLELVLVLDGDVGLLHLLQVSLFPPPPRPLCLFLPIMIPAAIFKRGIWCKDLCLGRAFYSCAAAVDSAWSWSGSFCTNSWLGLLNWNRNGYYFVFGVGVEYCENISPTKISHRWAAWEKIGAMLLLPIFNSLLTLFCLYLFPYDYV